MPDFMQVAFQAGYSIESSEQARKWILELVEAVKVSRAACDLATTVAEQRRLHRLWLLRHGSALGALQALHRCRQITDLMAEELHKEILATMAPTVIPFGGR